MEINELLGTEPAVKRRGRPALGNKEDFKIITFRVKKEKAKEIKDKVKELIKSLS